MNEEFWDRINELVQTSRLVIDRPKGSAHHRFQEVVYPLDYGYLEGTTGGDGQGIDLWLGSQQGARIDAIICTIDTMRRDAEIKLLLGCTNAEKREILAFHNRGGMSGILLQRRPEV